MFFLNTLDSFRTSETHSVIASLFAICDKDALKSLRMGDWATKSTTRFILITAVESDAGLHSHTWKPRFHILWSCAKFPWLKRTPWKKNFIIAATAPKPNIENSNQYNLHTLYYARTHFFPWRVPYFPCPIIIPSILKWEETVCSKKNVSYCCSLFGSEIESLIPTNFSTKDT